MLCCFDFSTELFVRDTRCFFRVFCSANPLSDLSIVCFVVTCYLFQLRRDRHSHRLQQFLTLRFLLSFSRHLCITGCFNTFILRIVIGRTRLGYCCVSFLKFEIYMYAPSDFGKSYWWRLWPKRLNECVFSEFLYIYIYIYTSKLIKINGQNL